MTSNPSHFAVALDGPAGAGKSTIARRVAQEMGIVYVDTGAMYRAIGLFVARQGLDTRDPDCVLPQLAHIRISTAYDPEKGQQIFLNGEDVSQTIRSPEMSMAASNVSSLPQVRAFLLEQQRQMAREQSVIMDGRDIGTVVLPDAEVKVFLTASPEARAERRMRELEQRGTPEPYEKVLAEIRQRDYNDSHRAAAPLRQAEDAVVLDTTELNFQESEAALLRIIRERGTL